MVGGDRRKEEDWGKDDMSTEGLEAKDGIKLPEQLVLFWNSSTSEL